VSIHHRTIKALSLCHLGERRQPGIMCAIEGLNMLGMERVHSHAMLSLISNRAAPLRPKSGRTTIINGNLSRTNARP
jgi:hypothetical protein